MVICLSIFLLLAVIDIFLGEVTRRIEDDRNKNKRESKHSK